MFADAELCPVCASPARDRSLLCIVESPADVAAIEQSGSYRGCYFVLMGHLSPLDGIGPDEPVLLSCGAPCRWGVKEAILATEYDRRRRSDGARHFELAARRRVKSRIAHGGVPMGGELEYVDGGTLAHALAGRHSLG
jgi:recombination protein RecR